jgi:protoporphyrinogen oxidase
MTKVLFAGSSLPSLILSKFLKNSNSEIEIDVIDRSSNHGGQYTSYRYGEKIGKFDQGIHIIYTTGIPEIDQEINSVLSSEESYLLEDNEKDIAGVFFDRKLQTQTPYIDLATLDNETWKKCISEVFENVRTGVNIDKSNCQTILQSKFGVTITNQFLEPILNKVSGYSARDLDPLALRVIPLDRVSLFSKDVMEDLHKSTLISLSLCYPDQFSYPGPRTFGQVAVYPKEFGISNYIDRLVSQAQKADVNLYTDATISNIELLPNGKVRVDFGKGIKEYDKIFWAAGIPTLAKIVAPQLVTQNKITTKKKVYYLNLVFDAELNADRLYYFYVYDQNFLSHRVSFHYNYCPSLKSLPFGYKITVEVQVPQEGTWHPEELTQVIMNELKSMNVVSNQKCLFLKIEPAPLLPSLTLSNINSLFNIRDELIYKFDGAIEFLGLLSEPNVFFSTDILSSGYQKVCKLLKQISYI